MLLRWSLTLVCCLYCCPEQQLVKFKSHRGPLVNQALLRFKRNPKLLKLSGCVLETFVVPTESRTESQPQELASTHGWPELLDEDGLP